MVKRIEDVNSMGKNRVLYSILSLTLILGGILIPLVTAEKTDSITLGPSMTGTLVQNLDSGNSFTGRLSVSGGDDYDVKFWVTGPSGQTILDKGTVILETSFEFTTEQSGAYTFHFDNSDSSADSKDVTMSYTVEKVSNLNLWIGSLVFILFLAGGLLLRTHKVT